MNYIGGDKSSKKDTKPTWESVASALGDAAILAGGVALKGAKWAGGKIGEGAQNVYKTTIEDKKKLDEIKQISEYCERTKNTLENGQAQRENMMDQEVRQYTDLCKKVYDRMRPAMKYKLYYNSAQENIHLNKGGISHSIQDSVSLSDYEVAGTSIKKGGLAGAAAGGGAAALMTALGTASTGTAISSLSGAAFTHALLASFGGGSLASGGLGMVGGTIVLGSIIAIPALAVGGYVADKQINDAYKKAKECEKKAKDAETECQRIFALYDEGIELLKKINQGFTRFHNIFSRIVDLSIMAASYPKMKSDYNRLLDMSIGAANDYMDIELVDDNGEINRNTTQKISLLKYAYDECGKRLSQLQEDMTADEMQVAESVPVAQFDIYEEQIKQYKFKVDQLNKTVEKQGIELKKKDTIIEEKDKKINKMHIALEKEKKRYAAYAAYNQQCYADLKEQVINAQNEVERVKKEKELFKEERDRLRNDFPASYDSYIKSAKKRYPNVKNKEVFEFIATGELNHDIYSKLKQGDFSCIAVEYAKSVERLMYDVIRTCLDARVSRGATLGNLMHEYVYPKRYSYFWKHGIGENLDKILKSLCDIRNAGAHKEIITEKRMQETRILVLGGGNEGLTKNGLLAYLDGLMK